MDSLSKFKDSQPPQNDAFYSKLNDEHISEDDDQHAHQVWKEFECKSMKDYHDLYLKSDVPLLVDVFENFRQVCIANYELDPVRYYTVSGLAWDAALKKTHVNLELLTDPDMLLMFEKGIRGGISMIPKRYAKANNKNMNDLDLSKPFKFITYLDTNNLYGWAICKQLPTGGFKWMNEKEIVKVG